MIDWLDRWVEESGIDEGYLCMCSEVLFEDEGKIVGCEERAEDGETVWGEDVEIGLSGLADDEGCVWSFRCA